MTTTTITTVTKTNDANVINNVEQPELSPIADATVKWHNLFGKSVAVTYKVKLISSLQLSKIMRTQNKMGVPK